MHVKIGLSIAIGATLIHQIKWNLEFQVNSLLKNLKLKYDQQRPDVGSRQHKLQSILAAQFSRAVSAAAGRLPLHADHYEEPPQINEGR